jgi:NADH:ubiquinone oxidoreductase subunit F (NADH-binding)
MCAVGGVGVRVGLHGDLMRRDEAARLEEVLVRADEFEREVCRRSDAVRELKKALIDGVAVGAFTLDAQPTMPGIAVVER